MAKSKKKNLSKKVENRSKIQKKKLNPFDVHVNKEKIKVLGRKLKNDKGLPGVSRAKAIKKRKQTLLQEYKIQNKSNKFTDRRIGERNKGMTEEDRIVARFAAVRAKTLKRKNIFNLADDEILTHKGQTISEIEKFDDPRSDDEESIDGQNNSGRLERRFVQEAHFGGGLFKNTGVEGAKSHKDLIDQLIAESKKRKAEKQMIKEQTMELTEKLDTDWKDLLPLVHKSKKEPEIIQNQVDDFDKVMRELKFEARGTPSDRLKTEDEIAKEEKEKLEKLEEERLQRMKGFMKDEANRRKHKSADDLDDNFVYDSDPDITLSYNKEGQSNVKLDVKMNRESLNDDEEQIDNENSDEEEQDDEEKSDKEEQEYENSAEGENDENSSRKEKITKTINMKDSDDSAESESEDDLSDLKTESSDSEIDEIEPNKNKRKFDDEATAPKKTIKIDLQAKKEMMDKARKELPYTFKLPESYEDFQKVLQNQSSHHQSVIIERMIKCNHPGLNASNKESLSLVFVYVLQHLSDISTDLTKKDSVRECFDVFNNLVPQLYDLAQLNQESAQNSMLEVIKEKQEEFRKSRKCYPDLDVLLYLKLVSCLFPTSDFRHLVVTPSIVFIEQMLKTCRIKSKRDVSYGLFLVALILEYTVLSKRFLPTAINYLLGIIHMAVPKSIKLLKIIPPFKLTSTLLVLENSSEAKSLKMNCTDLIESEIDDDFRVRSLGTAVMMLQEFNSNFKELPSRCEIFESVFDYLKLLPETYPETVVEEIKRLQKHLDEDKNNRKLEHIVMEKKKPKPLRLYEPNIQKVYDGKKHKIQSKEKAERDKLLHKLKREKKGALREIRRDQSFLGRLKIKQHIQSDLERKEKVKKIFAEASIQQNELNTLTRKNKRKTNM